MTLATQADVAAAMMRELTDVELRYVDGMLSAVESMIAIRKPHVLLKAATDENLRRLVVRVEAEAVSRVFRNPGGAFSSESEGDYTYQINRQVASGVLSILPDEWELLDPGGTWGGANPTMDGYAARRGYVVPKGAPFPSSWPGNTELDRVAGERGLIDFDDDEWGLPR